jgi:hypothetical protein
MLQFKSYALASYLIARGNKVEGARIDVVTDVPYFVFADTEQAREDELEYRQVVKYLNGLANLARITPGFGHARPKAGA